MASCSLKDSASNGFKTESKIKPFAETKTLAQTHGDGREAVFTVKIPLTESSIGYFDVDEVLGNSQLNARKRNFFERIYDSFRIRFYNMFVYFGISNKMKYSILFDFPELNDEFIVSTKVKKVFFTTEDCRPEEDDCNDRGSYSSNFNFLDKFFVNVSAVEADTVVSDEVESVDSSDFDKVSASSFAQNKLQAQNMIKSLKTKAVKKFNKNSDNLLGNESEDEVGINLVKFKNNTPSFSISSDSVSDEDRFLFFTIENSEQRTQIKDYLKRNKFKPFIKRVRSFKDGLEIALKEDAVGSDVFNIINSESQTTKNMYIFRLNSKFVEAKKFFKNSDLSQYIKDTTMIGKSLFVELRDDVSKQAFAKLLKQKQNLIDSELDIYKVERCVSSNCLDLDVKDVNLLPLLSSNKKLKVDTYLSVRSLGNSDFKYNGYIEVEVKWLPPL